MALLQAEAHCAVELRQGLRRNNDGYAILASHLPGNKDGRHMKSQMRQRQAWPASGNSACQQHGQSLNMQASMRSGCHSGMPGAGAQPEASLAGLQRGDGQQQAA